MATTTLGQRLTAAMTELGIHPAELARRAKMTTATMANWLGDKVEPEHVKAQTLFQIADAAQVNARELLWGSPDPHPSYRIGEAKADYPSQSVTLDDWIIAFQLVAEVLDAKGNTLPPAKRAEVTLLAHEFLVEGMPRAKVLRFVQAAAG
jgi:transcriptional regulator with XRE-family HTH domain